MRCKLPSCPKNPGLNPKAPYSHWCDLSFLKGKLNCTLDRSVTRYLSHRSTSHVLECLDVLFPTRMQSYRMLKSWLNLTLSRCPSHSSMPLFVCLPPAGKLHEDRVASGLMQLATEANNFMEDHRSYSWTGRGCYS